MFVEPGTSPIAGWENFYVIIGSSGAALIGLQFVVIALISEGEVASTHEQIGAFGTPTIVHFSAVVFTSAAMSAPWPVLADVQYALGLCGIAGVIYMTTSIRRLWRQTGYSPVMEDWLWHAALPVAAYAVLVVAGYALRTHIVGALFGVGGVALLLLFIGIHNSWDTVTFIVLDSRSALKQGQSNTDR